MGIVFTNHNIDLLSVEFDEITKIVITLLV
ncbi:hypothetical protein BANRA_02437 [Escherichia coli]|nr:hypothetical protein BANRA_01016 [Escherichia coli]VCY78848.1 hypothetical protein BANRA_02437 [Escherichia coli]